jgi:diguanylate cyclase (GGDEF)-like protein
VAAATLKMNTKQRAGGCHASRIGYTGPCVSSFQEPYAENTGTMDINKKNSLLIVDDDRSNLMMLSGILKEDYAIRVASDGESAIRIAEQYLPDLILLDVLMPDMDGYQVFTALQNSDITSHIPVIFITGLNNTDDEKRGLQLGAADYISKPFDDMVVKLRIHHQIRIINQLRTIERLSMIDQLTGIHNRRSFDERLREVWKTSTREEKSISLLIVDVDHFKNYNDTFGHPQGDIALCSVAQALTQTLNRASDLVARWGGEEFVVLLPNTDINGGLYVSEEMRRNVETLKILRDDGFITSLTVSIGLNSHKPTMLCSVDDFFSRADKALYAAKTTGRNKVCVAE